jgi:uncharacterized repeat protein (TIGR01451 family)
METTSYPPRAGYFAYVLFSFLIALSGQMTAQSPLVAARFSNPSINCLTLQYCLDVEFRSSPENLEVFGMNVRFFYDDAYLEFQSFTDFQGGYGPVSPNPPVVSSTIPGTGTTFFGLPAPGIADFVNGAIQLVDNSQPPLLLDDENWTKLFQVCFTIDGVLADSSQFCPPVIWDLEADPANGGYLPGDDGVVITIVDQPPFMSTAAMENVEQFNWAYSGPGTPPYGAPEPVECISILCPVDLALEKTLNSGQDDLQPGDNVTFTIEVFNEGDVPAGQITVTDYIPTGFTLNDADWTAGTAGSTGQSASITLSVGNGALPAGGLLNGQSVTVEITLQIMGNITPDVYFNFAEITSVFDPDGGDITSNDIDSTPDDDDTNDPEEEDDHDFAVICLLVPPAIDGELFVCEGDIAVYSVLNYNPAHDYVFSLPLGGGTIINTTPSSITIEWTADPGSALQVELVEIAHEECQSADTITVMIEEAGAIACIDEINISINNGCGTVITSGMILTGEMEGNNTYEVIIIDMNGDTVPNATLTWEHVGQRFKVSVVSTCTGQGCWGWINVEDKLGPIISCVCPEEGESIRCDVNCLQIAEILEGNVPLHLRPTVIDNCGDPTLELVNVDLHYETCSGGYILLSWLATDPSGNTSTCEQRYNIVPLTLESLAFPEDYYGECGDDSDPSNTGWPQVNGGDITLIPGHCNIISDYKDKPIQMCGGGVKIMRTWTVFDWCVPTKVDHVQFIHLPDHTGPAITCTSNIQKSTDVWSCTANVVVQRPQAIDACSDVSTYKLTSTAGVVVPQGNNFVITQLPVGIHTATWTITDECYNSSTCSFTITIRDLTPPTVTCHLHTVVALTSDRPNGLTIVDASVFDDGSYDNCGPVTFRARRMDSCLDFDWTTEGACMDETPGGHAPHDSRDHGTVLRDCVPFACCDIGREGLMVELEVTDRAGNKNYCMVEVEVQDKLAPSILCPDEIHVSCNFPLIYEEGIYSDTDNDGSLNEDPLSEVFGNIYDAFRHTQASRQHIIINDPGNPQLSQPFDWGLEGWASDNCELALTVEVRASEDCTGESFPGKSIPGAVKLIERIFRATDGVQTRSCTQRIFVVDYDRFYISDTNCNNDDPLDGIIWPCDVLLNTCPDDIGDTGEPVLLYDGCSIVGVTHEDKRFDFVDSVCFKILREWKVLDWCQFDPETGAGIWTYVQTIKVADSDGVDFLDAPVEPVEYCTTDPGISLPENNQVFLGEGDPEASSCSVHMNISLNVHEACSGSVLYDVKIYPYNGTDFIQIVPETLVFLDEEHNGEINYNTATCGIPSIEENGLPYTSAACGEYHRALWTVEDGCGNRSYADYLFRLEDCKDPTPVCIEGISTVIMPGEGEVTIDAEDFNASSFDDCTPGDELIFSFSGDTYEPSFTYTCDNVPEFDVELPVEIWAADEGVDQNCDGVISWSERNKSFCITTIVINDPENACDNEGGTLEGEVITEKTDAVSSVAVRLSRPGSTGTETVTTNNGRFTFQHVPQGNEYMITPVRNDDPKNGVSTLDLVHIQKHLLGQETFESPYQYIAADANNSQSVSALDLIEIRKVILGLQDGFSNNQSWRFVRKDQDLAAGNPWPFTEYISLAHIDSTGSSGLDFIGVKVGDINHSVKANSQQVTPRNARKVMYIKVSGKAQVEAGENVVLDLTFPEMISGFQWTLETKGLDYLGLTSDEVEIGDQHIGQPKPGMVTMSWNTTVEEAGFDQKGFSIRLTFKATERGKVMDMLKLTDAVTDAEVYTLEQEEQEPKLTFNSAGIFDDYALYQNKPNPWNHQTVIGFHLPVEAAATITLFDVEGREVKRINGEYKAGYNSIVIATDDLPSTGIYYYRLESGGFVASKKMVMVQ